jgi:hypothetical protein
MPRKTSQDFQNILNQLRENDQTLTSLDLSENKIDYEIDDEKAEQLAGALFNNNILIELNLGNSEINNDLRIRIDNMINKNYENRNLNISGYQTDSESEELTTPARPTRETTPQSPYQSKEESLSQSIRDFRLGASEQFGASVSPESSIGQYANEGTIPKGKQSLRQSSGGVQFDAIEIGIDNGNEIKISDRKIKKNSGYDENFRLEKREQWKAVDREFNLNGSPANFKKAFAYSRLPTNSYIHFRGENDATTGHPGGLIKTPEKLVETKRIQLILKKKEDPSFSESRRAVSAEAAVTLKSTKGGSAVGSASFHKKRQSAIDKVIVEARAGNNKLKKDSPIKATVEALKFVINTVSYKDNTPENQDKFKGITTDGLNLEDETQREYALKHYQAERDLMKLGVLKHEGRLNDVDSDGEDSGDEASETYENVSLEIQRINRKLARTKLEEKFHGEVPEAKRNLSPLRSASPYSRAVITTAIEELRNADSYEEIARVYATPIPVLNPAESLIKKEEEIRSTGRSRIGLPSQSENDSPIPPQPNFEEDAEKKSPEQQSSGGERTPSSSPTRSLGEKFSTPSSSRKI